MFKIRSQKLWSKRCKQIISLCFNSRKNIFEFFFDFVDLKFFSYVEYKKVTPYDFTVVEKVNTEKENGFVEKYSDYDTNSTGG